MTHDGSFPGRPRGRRARHDSDVSGWPGHDAAQQDQREFPDLSPIRPRESRARDSRARDDWQGQQEHQWPQDPQLQDPQPQGQHAMGQHAMGQHGPGQAARVREPDEDIPDWAEPDSVEAFSMRWHRRGLDSRGDRRSGRRKRRRVLIGAAGAAVVVIAVAVYFLIGSGGSGSPNLGFGSLVTTFLPGELQSVPDACDTVPGTMLSEFLPGTLKQASPPLNTGASTECTWTLDSPPAYRVLQVQLVAYSPNALYNNGSATSTAEVTYGSSEEGFVRPGPKSGAPPATVTDLSGMPGGNETSAFAATQVFSRNGAITDVVTVLVRYRNVIVTVVVNGLDQASGARKYGPVAMSDLSAAARTVAREVAGKIVG